MLSVIDDDAFTILPPADRTQGCLSPPILPCLLHLSPPCPHCLLAKPASTPHTTLLHNCVPDAMPVLLTPLSLSFCATAL